MHLKNFPTYYVKGGQRKAAYYTVQARELEENGWKPETEKKTAKPKAVAPVVEEVAVEEVVKQTEATPEAVQNVNLDEMTRAELVSFAENNGIEFKSYASKGEVLEACKEFANG